MKKKIAFYAKSLGIGGIGRACINYINMIDKDKYDVTLFLQKKTGAYLEELEDDIKVIDFNICEDKNPIIRKIVNFYKLLYFGIKYYHKFYFAAHFATTVKSGAILTKYFSKNNAFWFHGDYWNNEEEKNKFLKWSKVNKYKKIVFVSYNSMNIYKDSFKNTKQKLYVINNPINYEEIITKSNMNIKVDYEGKLLLNVGRHEEYAKNLSMLINCISRLVKNNYKLKVLFVGEGPDTLKYKEMVNDLKLDKYIEFIGFSNNVYPYYKKCDAVLLTSRMEGNPVVYLEAKILHKPVISTDVADAKKELSGYGIVTEQNEEAYYLGLKEFLDKGYKIQNKFNPEKYNKDVMNKLYQVIEDKYEN